MIARALSFASLISNSLYDPIAEDPDLNPGSSSTTVVLKVYASPGTTTCSTNGPPQLLVKVGVVDPTGTAMPGARAVTVYSWSVQR